MEIEGIAALDLDNHTAMHSEAVQTLPREGEILLGFYARTLVERAEKLKAISNTVVADACFSKKEFAHSLSESGLDLVSRFRDDVRLQYLIEPVKTGKRGRPCTSGGAVDVKKPDRDHFQKVMRQDNSIQIYTAVVKAVAMKRTVRVIVVNYVENRKPTTKIYFSTNCRLNAMEILDIYQTRFQIEFLYRDVKQHTALNHCQALSKNKQHFHFNISLTAVNVAKAVHWYSIPKKQREEFSMRDIKVMNHNALLLDRFMAMVALRPNILKNNRNVKELILYGTKCA
ncbi:MAG: transposase [Paludibacteraceae bacterium]